MFRLNHNDAVELEYQICRLYKCNRGGVSGLADADNFESNPMCAAYMVISYIYAKGLEINDYDDEYGTSSRRNETCYTKSIGSPRWGSFQIFRRTS